MQKRVIALVTLFLTSINSFSGEQEYSIMKYDNLWNIAEDYLGEKGINFMIEDGRKVPFKFFFGVPSCVPATSFETSGAVIDSTAVEKLIKRKDL